MRTCVSRRLADVAPKGALVLVEFTSAHLQRAMWALGRAIRAHKCALIDILTAKLATSEAATATAYLCANDSRSTMRSHFQVAIHDALAAT